MHDIYSTFLALALLLFTACLGAVSRKFGQPVILGEITGGILLSFLGFIGLPFVSGIRDNEIIAFLAEFGIVILLFQIGFEAEISKLIKAGTRSIFVAAIGILLPFLTGTYILAPLLLPDTGTPTRLFIGLSLVATSIGITAGVFRELNKMRLRVFQIILGAAVIDDVIGLVLLSIASTFSTSGEINWAIILLSFIRSFGFLIVAIIVGRFVAFALAKLFSLISTAVDMKLSLALIFVLVYAYLASLFGLSPIIGAFAAGIALDLIHFEDFDLPRSADLLQTMKKFSKHERRKIDVIIDKLNKTHVERLIESIGILVIPVFFVYTGLQIDIPSLLKPDLYITAFIFFLLAVFSKVAAGFAIKGRMSAKLLVGFAMVPRGEVGLIFASVGKAGGLLTDELYSLILLVVILTTFVSPPVITYLIKKYFS